MGILFKTYNGKHQLHVCREIWTLPNKEELDNILGFFRKKELAKAKITPTDDTIELEMNGMIMDCKDAKDLKAKFSLLVDLKSRFQKLTSEQPKKNRKK